MASKYDEYWRRRLTQLTDVLGVAASAGSVRLAVAGLRDRGTRESWYGFAEVRGRTMVRSSMAHMASLGSVVADSGVCGRWPDRVFRFSLDASGRELSIRVSASRPPGAGSHAEPRAGSGAPGRHGGVVPGLGGAPRPGTRDDSAAERQADVDQFYRALSRLTDLLSGPKRLADCTGKDAWPRRGVYFFYEDGEVRADGSGRIVRIGTHALTATSRTTLWGRLRQHRGNWPASILWAAITAPRCSAATSGPR